MKKKFLYGAFLIAALLVCARIRWAPSQWKDVLVMPFYKNQAVAEVTLHQGESLSAFALKLAERGIVVSRRNFLYWLARKGADRTLRAGTYRISSGPSWYAAEQLKNAKPVYISATILPGAFPECPLPFGTLEQQRAELSKLENFPEQVWPILPDDALARAAFLLPETYMLITETLPELIRKASTAWFKRFGHAVSDKTAALRTAVIASLLQREAQVPEEYPVIAGVIENRLNKGMLLQIDASVVYAWYHQKGEVIKRVLYKHLELDSPYNTYKYAGLPPEPICVPSAAAWEGALSPEKNDYLYYVSSGDGRHTFAKSQSEHEKNVNAYRKKKQ